MRVELLILVLLLVFLFYRYSYSSWVVEFVRLWLLTKCLSLLYFRDILASRVLMKGCISQ